MWTVAQRRFLAGLLLCAAVALLILRLVHPVYVSDPEPSQGARFAELQDRIDPNTASAAALATLPSLGEKRAREIVDFRDALAKNHPGQPVYKSSRDLLKIKGVGVSIVANIEPYLIFPDKNPATHATTNLTHPIDRLEP